MFDIFLIYIGNYTPLPAISRKLFVLLINKAIFITATIEKENKFNCKGIEFEIEIRNKVKEKLWIILN